MAFDEEYFIIHRENNNSYPLLINDTGCPPYHREKKFIENAQRMYFCFGKPIPKKPVMADYHSSPKSIISDRVYNILNNLNIKGLQLIPATVNGKKEKYENYYFIHIYNIIPALDLEKSKCEWDDFIKVASPIEKIVLRETELEKNKLEERLVFRFAENTLELFRN